MQAVLNIGVDVSKAKIDIAVEQTHARRCLPNTRAALDKWLGGLPPASRLAMEASGEYHELLAELAHARGLEVFVLNPKDVRHYAKSMGLRAKTDRVDAAVIARLVANEHGRLHPFSPPSGEQREIVQLIRRRAKASSMRRAAQASFQGIASLDQPVQALLECVDRLIQSIDARLAVLEHACPQRQQALERLRTIDGVGPVVSAALHSTLERITFRGADAFVAYHGLDTRVDDSGTRTGRRRLSKRGPAEMRRLLYNAAMAAVRTKAWKPVYEHYLEQGWPRTAALMIIARRILRTAWSIHHHGTTFDPERPIAGLTRT